VTEAPDRYVRERDPFFIAAAADTQFCKLYDIETWQPVGSGVSGRVVRILQKIRQEYVAVKLIPDIEAETQHKVASEVRIATQVSSDSVVRINTPLVGDNLLWIEMEYVDGPTLRMYLDQARRERKRLPLAEAAGLGLAVVEGVQAIHKAGVVHRDLKPQNIILPSAGRARAKIADFGISRLRDEERATMTGEWRGTPAYAPPEFFAGAGGAMDDQGPRRKMKMTPEGDVYSLGMVLYEVFTGEYPYPNVDLSDAFQVSLAHIQGVPTSPTRYNAQLPDDLERLILRMLAKAPGERPAIVEVFETLGRVQDPSAPASSSTTEKASPPASSRQVALIGLAAAVVLLVAALIMRSPSSSAVPPIDDVERQAAVSSPVASAVPTEVPATATPPPSPPVATLVNVAAPAVAAATPQAFQIKMDPEGVILRNESKESVTGIEFTLRDVAGRRYLASSDDLLEPRADLFMPLVLFYPDIPEGAKLAQVDVVIRHTPSGAKAMTVPLK
jgi:serine/threonine-protein kinase